MAVFTAIATAIGSAIAGVSAFIGGLGVVGSFLLKTAVGLGLNLLAQAIAGKPQAPTFSVNGTLRSGGDVPRSFILGRTMTAGSLVWANTWGKDGETSNAFLSQVIALSDLPVQGLVEVWVNGELVTLGETAHADGRGYPVAEYAKDGADNLWIKFYDGTQEAGDAFLLNNCSSLDRPWESSRVGTGVPYAIATARVAGNMFAGIPSFKFVLDGLALYDISKDDTAGGVGDHRWSDPATWGGDGDHLPAVQAYNLLRGITYGGTWFYGLQGLSAAPARLPAANWIAAIEKCRAPIVGAAGAEPSYRSAGEITVDAPIASALEAINTACLGRISEVGGVYSMFLGAPDDASFSFTDDDIVVTEEQSFTPFFGLADTINGIFANYPSPADGWTVKSAPPIYRSDLEAKHGNRRLMADVALDLVPYPEQVQRLQLAALLEGQRARRHTLVLPPSFWAYAVPGAICSWTSTREGYTSKLFRIDGVADRANLDVMIDITEVDPDDFAWDTETDYQPPVDGAVGVVRPTPQPIVDFFAEADTVVGSGDRVRPAIRLEWDGDLADLAGVEFQVRLESTAEVVHKSRTDDYAAGAIKISNNLFSLTEYGVRARYIPNSDRDTSWSDWLPVTTLDVRNTDVLAKLDNLGEDVKAQIVAANQSVAYIRARLEQLAAAASDVAGEASTSQSVAKRFRNATAAAFTELSAEIVDLDGLLTATAEATTAILAAVGEDSAEILWRLKAIAGATGDIVSRVDLQVRATVADDYVSSGLVLEAGYTGGNPAAPFSRVLLYGSEVVIANAGGDVSALFENDGGNVFIRNAFIHNLDASNITADKLDATEILQDGTLITELFAFGAVTEYEDIAFDHSIGPIGGTFDFNEGAYIHKATIIVDNPAATPLIEFVSARATGNISGTGTFNLAIVCKRNGSNSNVVDGETFCSALRNRASVGNGTTFSAQPSTNFRNLGETSVRYDIWTWNELAVGGSSTGSFTTAVTSGALFWKR